MWHVFLEVMAKDEEELRRALAAFLKDNYMEDFWDDKYEEVDAKAFTNEGAVHIPTSMPEEIRGPSVQFRVNKS